jgi:hypothetical protein
MNTLSLTIGKATFEIELALGETSETLRRLRKLLPWESELHYAKVAGEEVIACIPFLVPRENVEQVDGIEPGSVCYWPDRAVLCCYYGRSTEVEFVTVIGRVREIERLRAAGERVRMRQGGAMRLEAT